MDKSKLKELALAATPGPWRAGSWGGRCEKPSHKAVGGHPGPRGDDPCVYTPVFYEGSAGIVGPDKSTVVSISYDALEMSEADGQFIAAANPAAILELLAENERLEATRPSVDLSGLTHEKIEELWCESGSQIASITARYEFARLVAREVLAPKAAQPAVHASDCAMHNEPAMPNGPCDCGAQPAAGQVPEGCPFCDGSGTLKYADGSHLSDCSCKGSPVQPVPAAEQPKGDALELVQRMRQHSADQRYGRLLLDAAMMIEHLARQAQAGAVVDQQPVAYMHSVDLGKSSAPVYSPETFRSWPLGKKDDISPYVALYAAPTQASAAQAEPVAWIDPLSVTNFKIGRSTREWMWAKPEAGNVPVFLAAPVAQEGEQSALTPLDYRAQGREEALAIILSQDPENPFADQTNSVFGGEDYSTEWDEVALRELLHIGDRKHDAYNRAEAAYWDAQGHKDEAERMMRMVEQAPFFKPLHDFLAKQQSHEAWELLGQLQLSAQSSTDASAQAAQADVRDAALEEAAKLFHSTEESWIAKTIRAVKGIRNAPDEFLTTHGRWDADSGEPLDSMAEEYERRHGIRTPADDSPNAIGPVCWSCQRPYTLEQRAEADGNCPHCGVEIELYDGDDSQNAVGGAA